MSRWKNLISLLFSTSEDVRVFLAMLCTLIPSGIYSQQDSVRLIERFKVEAPEAWKIAESAEDTPATLKISTKVERVVAGKVLRAEEKSLLLRRKASHLLLESIEGTSTSRIFGQNPQYSFSLSKAEGKEGWQLDKLQIKGEKGYGELDVGIFELIKPGSYSLIKQAPSFPKLVADPRFKVLRAEKTDADLIRVHIQTAIGAGNREMTAKGWIDLDSSNAWTVQGCELKIVSPPVGTMILVGTKTFTLGQRGAYRPCESWRFSLRAPGDFEAKEENRFTTVDSLVPPNEIFTLAYYGLPEPMGVAPLPQSHTWLWLLAGTVAAVALAVLFAWLKRRHTRTIARSSNAS